MSSTAADVVIVGGGLVGAALANALTSVDLDVVLVEARRMDRFEQPSFDSRVTALANGSRRILGQLGVFAHMAGDAEPIRHIHIGERGRFGAARIDARAEGVDALGYTVANRVLGESLWQALRGRARLRCLAPARVAGLEQDAATVRVRVDTDGVSETIGARLLIAADGAGSAVRASLGIGVATDAYGQAAIIANCVTEVPAAGRAFERFAPDGPLAVLPLGGDRVAIVWTLPAAAAAEVAALDDAAFTRALQQAFGYRLGRIMRVGARARHALTRQRSAAVRHGRCVLVGNAAVSLHPVAGQGFNLALRDTAALAELIAVRRAADGRDADIGAADVSAAYADWRRRDQASVAAFTHGLVRLFGLSAPGFGALRGLGLVAFDLMPGAKSLLARHTMGMAGRVPRLARGLDLPGAATR